jgi:thiol-disulfide isomerase/thioredoxin
MKIKLLFIAFIGFWTGLSAQEYRISLNYKPVSTKAYLYLGYYFGESKYLQDSVLLEPDGTATFSGKKKLTGGLYLIIDPEKKSYFDLLIDQEQTFHINIDTSDFSIASITGSSETQDLESYKKTTARIFKQLPVLQKELALAKNRADSLTTQKKINAAFEEAQEWREQFIQQHPDSYLSLLFRLMKEPVFKPGPGASRSDSILAYQNYKKQYWEGIPIGDERLLRTPVFEQRLNRYMEQVIRNPDTLKLEVDRFILSSRGSETMFKYYINRFTNEYMNPKYMGLDVVFLHLFEKYYLTNQVTWLSDKDRELVYNRAYSIMGNIIGEPAAELNLLDTLDQKTNLYKIKSPYTILAFWDPDCGHCREQIPVMDSLFRTKWQQHGITLIGILTDSVRTDKSKLPAVKESWKEFIQKHHLKGWLHWYQSFEMREEEKKNNKPGFRQYYDVFQTPTLYLLDQDKRIIAKKINPQQLDELLEIQRSKINSKNK